MATEVNRQIVESIVVTNESVLSDAPVQSYAVTIESYAYSISLLMMNAVSTQNSAAQIANASTVTACAEILRSVAI